MKKMMELYDHMADEAKDGKAYAKSAAKVKDTDKLYVLPVRAACQGSP